MKLSEFNEYAQTGAAVVAIIGIFLLGYEIRQSSQAVRAAATEGTWTEWVATRPALIETGISDVLTKAMTAPHELTLADKGNLDSYHETWINLYHQTIETQYWANGGDLTGLEYMIEEVAQQAPYQFGSKWSRGWLMENESWMNPTIFAAIQRVLKDAPLGSDLAYYERIDERAAAMD